ncbi:MAG: hypothetical protein RLZZ502_137 [Pseudomonadota bacterium]
MQAIITFFTSRGVIFGLLALVLGVLGFKYISKLNPAPPNTIDFSAGSKGGAYDKFAQAYASYLAKEGVTLNIIQSGGTLANLDKLLVTKKAQAGFIQSGLASPEQIQQLNGLAAVTFEPVWVFTRTRPISNLAELAKLNLALPQEGSGARASLAQLFTHSGLSINPKWQSHDLDKAIELLDTGKIDAVFTVASIASPLVQKLLLGKHHLMNFAHAQAVARQLPAYSLVTLPRGAVNAGLDIPAQNIQLIAPQAILAANSELHPALAYLLLDAAQKVHSGTGLLHEPNQFPNAKVAEFTPADEALRYFKEGKPFLERFLPYWLANLIARLLFVLIPLFAILFPIIKLEPELEAFICKLRLQPHYKTLHHIESGFVTATGTPSAELVQKTLSQLSALEQQAVATKVPTDHLKDRYALLQNIAVVHARVQSYAHKA